MKKSIGGWLNSVAVLAVISGFAAGIYSLSDTHVVVRYFTDSTDKTIGSLIYVVVGSWIGCLLFLPQGQFLGRWLSRDQFQGWQRPVGRDWLYVCSAGFTGAGATFFYLLGLSRYGPSRVVVLSSAVLVLLLMLDFVRRRIDLSMTFPASIVFLGILLSSMNFEDGIKISVGLILIVLIAHNFLYVLSIWFFQAGSRRMDSINFTFWRFLSFAVFATVFVVIWVVVAGKVGIFQDVLFGGFTGALPFILFTMIFGFLEVVLESQARRDGGKMSMVSFLKQSAIIPAMFLTYLLNWIWVGSLGDVATDTQSVVIRVGAAALVLLGLYLLTRRKLVEEQEIESEEILVVV